MFGEKNTTSGKESSDMFKNGRSSNVDSSRIDPSMYKDQQEDCLSIPPTHVTRRPLSVSRSGRCKSKNKTRSRMLSEELYVKDDLAISQDTPSKDSHTSDYKRSMPQPSTSILAKQANGSTAGGVARIQQETDERTPSGTGLSTSGKYPIQSGHLSGSLTRNIPETSKTTSGMVSTNHTRLHPVTTSSSSRYANSQVSTTQAKTYQETAPGESVKRTPVNSVGSSRLQPKTSYQPTRNPPAPTRQVSQTSSGMSTCDTSSPSSRSSSTTERDVYSTAL